MRRARLAAAGLVAAVAGALLAPVPAVGGAGAEVAADAVRSADAAGAARTAGDRAADVRRETTLGPVLGKRSGGTHSWLGIPYAEPPVGALRWRPPVTAEPWTRPFRATEPGQGCPQPGRFFSPSPDGPHYSLRIRDGLGKAVGREDCLTLNVYRPASAAEDLPVIVFIHGGSNTVGYSADPMYDGRALARRADAVVVTVNYRLGLLGWMNLAQLEDGDPVNDSGNFGTLDQIEALRFVEANAEAFGGDPDNVTIMGESAGSVNVWALLVSPLTEGLVDKAIPMSGGFQFTNEASSRSWADAFAAAAVQEAEEGEDTSDLAAYLRSKPARWLVSLLLRHPELTQNPPAVIPDGTVLPTDWRAAVAAGDYRSGPVLAGNTLEEGKLFGSLAGAYRPSDRRRFTMQHRFDPDAPRWTAADFLDQELLPVDRPGGWNDVSAGIGDAIFTPLTLDSMDALQAAGEQQLFYYQFAWNQEPDPFCEVYGAVHAMDLPFVFGTFGRHVYSFAFSEANERGRKQLSRMMRDAVERFVRTGDPQHRGLGREWETWPAAMVLDANDRRARTVLEPAALTQAGQTYTHC